jgi:protein phosphatase
MGTAGKEAWVVPAPAYRKVEGWEGVGVGVGVGEDDPGFRCGHSLSAVAPTKGHGPRLILFGGATAIEAGASSGLPGISSVLPSPHHLRFRFLPLGLLVP